MKVLVTQLCPTLWNPMDCSPPGSSIHGILQARIVEWVAIPFSRGSPGIKPAAAVAKSLQSCPTLCDPIDGSPPGSPVPGILQARTLGWVAISFSRSNLGLPHCRQVLYHLSRQGPTYYWLHMTLGMSLLL